MTRYVFEKVQRRASKRVKCSECGKALTRSKTFMQTLNPWNAHPDGTPRTEREIWDALGVEAQGWQSQPVRCTTCAGVAP